MDELERKALLGDKKAQEECTLRWIVLPCPFCGGEAKLKKGFPSRQIAHCRQALVQCKKCGNRTVTYKQLPMGKWQEVDYSALSAWNSRPAPPVGRCDKCQNWRGEPGEEYAPCKFCDGVTDCDGYCNGFEPKEHEDK